MIAPTLVLRCLCGITVVLRFTKLATAEDIERETAEHLKYHSGEGHGPATKADTRRIRATQRTAVAS